MTRATSVVLLAGGTLLLVMWLVSPATSAPQTMAPRPSAADAQVPPELEDVNQQVDRLRARLDQVVAYPEPSRDPFRFAPRARIVRTTPEVIAPPELSQPSPVTPAWPALVAILTPTADGPVQAALSASDELHVLAVGGTIGTFTISEISADAIRLTDSVTGQTTRLVLR